MKVIGLVAARMKSSRLKKKAFLKLNEKPLILQLLIRLKDSKRLNDVVLCTSNHPEDVPLIKLAEENGFKSFAGSLDDVMDRFIHAGEKENPDIVVRITGDNPLTDPEVIDTLIDEHVKFKADYTRMDGLPIGITAEVINFDALKKAFKMAEDSGYSEYMTYYFTNYPDLFKLNIIQAPNDINRPQYRLTVDYPEDYELMRIIFDRFKQSSKTSLKEIVKFLDENPKIATINSGLDIIDDPQINTKLKI